MGLDFLPKLQARLSQHFLANGLVPLRVGVDDGHMGDRSNCRVTARWCSGAGDKDTPEGKAAVEPLMEFVVKVLLKLAAATRRLERQVIPQLQPRVRRIHQNGPWRFDRVSRAQEDLWQNGRGMNFAWPTSGPFCTPPTREPGGEGAARAASGGAVASGRAGREGTETRVQMMVRSSGLPTPFWISWTTTKNHTQNSTQTVQQRQRKETFRRSPTCVPFCELEGKRSSR